MLLRPKELPWRVVGRFVKPLREYVSRRLHYHTEVEGLDSTLLPVDEVVNETIATALRRRDASGRPLTFEWLRQIARSVIGRELDELRAREGREVSLDTPITATQPIAGIHPEEELTLADVIADVATPLPAEVYENDELWECVDRTFAALPEPWREIFFLHAVDGFTVDEVARLQGRPVEAIIHSVSQAREHLRRALREEFGDLLAA